MSSAVLLNNSASYVGDEPVPHTENQLMALCAIYALLNEAMGEGVKVQGDVATSLSTAQDKIRDTLETLNKNMGDLQGSIQRLQEKMDDLAPYLTGLTIATAVLGIAGMAVGPALVALQEGGIIAEASIKTVTATVTTVARVLNAIAQLASGGVGIYDGSVHLEQAGYTHELAPINADTSRGTAVQKNYQSTSKEVVADIGETMSRIAALAQSIAKDIRAINEGLREANRSMLQGVLGNYR